MLSIVLSRRNIRESDQLISLYTKEEGKLQALARGVKKITSKNSAHMEPFALLKAEIIPGKEVSHLGSVQSINIFKNIRADLEKSLLSAWSVSITDKLLRPGEPDKRIFELLVGWLEFLDQPAVSSQLIYLDAFAAKLFVLLGYDISFDEKIGVLEKSQLTTLVNGGWNSLNNLRLNAAEAALLHRIIYQFAVYHGEVKLGDWGKIKNFCG